MFIFLDWINDNHLTNIAHVFNLRVVCNILFVANFTYFSLRIRFYLHSFLACVNFHCCTINQFHAYNNLFKCSLWCFFIKTTNPKNILKVASIFNVWLNTFRELTWPQFVEKIWIFKIYHHANESVESDAVYLYRLLVSEKNKTFTSRLFISLLVFF